MFKIGEFSKLTQVSTRMLRYYDEMGLLKPAKIDSLTGYRMYSAEQISTLNRIIYLRDSGFNVAEIALALNYSNNAIIEQLDKKSVEIMDKSTHNRRERPVCGHRGRSRGPFYYRITTFGKGPWDARDPHKTTFMALKHVIRLSIWQRQKETPGVEKAPGVSSPQRKESGRSGRDDGELRFGYDPAIHARRLRVYHRPRRLRMASRISIFFAARRFEPLNSMG